MATQEVIRFSYTLRNKSGEVLDQSAEGNPLEFLSGSGSIIEGLENALLPMAEGESKEVLVRPEHGYGFRDESQIDVVDRSALPVSEVKVGDYFQAGGDRHSPVVQVVEVDGDKVTLDANHPLAGQDLFFSVQLLGKRAAKPDEIAHGHVHGAGHAHGHSHEGGCCGGGCGGH